MESNENLIGKRIAELRKKKGWNQKDLVEHLNQGTIQMISGWEKGSTVPTVFYLKKLVKALDTSLDYLVFGEKQNCNGSINNVYDAIESLIKLSENEDIEININDSNRSFVLINIMDPTVISFYKEYSNLLQVKDLLAEDFDKQVLKLKAKYKSNYEV